MAKAFVNLDMNSNNISNAANITAASEIRGNGYSHNGTAGIIQAATIIDDSAVAHIFVFTNGLLIGYSTKG